MSRTQDILDSIIFSLESSGELPDDVTFIDFDPDTDTQPIKLPIVQVNPIDAEDETETNTEFVKFAKDDDGNDVGKVFERLFRQEVNIATLAVQGSQFDAREMMDEVQTALFRHSTSGPFDTLEKPDGTTLDDVWRFDIGSSSQQNDLTTDPVLRRVEKTVFVSSSEQFVTTADEPPVEEIDDFEVEVKEK